jgi:ArsR family transcriptional regulator
MEDVMKMKRIEILADQLQTAGDPSRLKILCVIFSNKKMCVSDIAKEIGMSVAIVSHHLQVLAKAGIVSPEKEGKKVCYKVSPTPAVRDLKKFICKYK